MAHLPITDPGCTDLECRVRCALSLRGIPLHPYYNPHPGHPSDCNSGVAYALEPDGKRVTISWRPHPRLASASGHDQVARTRRLLASTLAALLDDAGLVVDCDHHGVVTVHDGP